MATKLFSLLGLNCSIATICPGFKNQPPISWTIFRYPPGLLRKSNTILRTPCLCALIIADFNSPVYQASKDYRKFLIDEGDPIIPNILIHQSTNYLKVINLSKKSDIIILDRFVLSNLVYLIARSDLEGIELDSAIIRDQLLKPFGINVLNDTTTI